MSSEMIWWGDFFSAEKKMFDPGLFVIFIFTLYSHASVAELENPLFPQPLCREEICLEPCNPKLWVRGGTENFGGMQMSKYCFKESDRNLSVWITVTCL